jgi:hypothetical protein
MREKLSVCTPKGEKKRPHENVYTNSEYKPCNGNNVIMPID